MNELLVLVAIFLFALVVLFFLHKKSQLDIERRITDLMASQLKEIRGSVDGTSEMMHKRMFSFTEETVKVKEELKRVEEAVKEISSFQDIFKAPNLRGAWGEAPLKHLLKEYFPEEFYTIQHSFRSGERVDAVLKLPDGKLLPIDAKFPLEKFEKIKKSESEEEKKIATKEFIVGAKKFITDVSEKYILQSEGTVDYALVYIPAEAVFYELMFNIKEEDIASYAWKKKVVLTSPNTFYLTLKVITGWIRDTKISRQTQEILKRVSRVQEDSFKVAEGFRRLGGHLKNAQSSYDETEKRISLFTDRVEKITNIKRIKNHDSDNKNGGEAV